MKVVTHHRIRRAKRKEERVGSGHARLQRPLELGDVLRAGHLFSFARRLRLGLRVGGPGALLLLLLAHDGSLECCGCSACAQQLLGACVPSRAGARARGGKGSHAPCTDAREDPLGCKSLQGCAAAHTACIWASSGQAACTGAQVAQGVARAQPPLGSRPFHLSPYAKRTRPLGNRAGYCAGCSQQPTHSLMTLGAGPQRAQAAHTRSASIEAESPLRRPKGAGQSHRQAHS